jgi:hypothetical protein
MHVSTLYYAALLETAPLEGPLEGSLPLSDAEMVAAGGGVQSTIFRVASRRNSKLLPMTASDDKPIRAPLIEGVSMIPKLGNRAPAAAGTCLFKSLNSNSNMTSTLNLNSNS